MTLLSNSLISSVQASGLGPILITPTRVEKHSLEIPAAISTIGQDDIQLGTEQLGLDESLQGVPGVFTLNRYNFAQDLRVSIRGFGARSNFGIRGVKIIVDGIPETLPDGQGSVDGVDIGSISQINVIRGPVSSLYGNASGGAILIETESGPVTPFAEARTTFGDYNFSKLQLKAGGETNNLNYLLNVSDTAIDGYRDNSNYENTQLNARFETTLTKTSSLLTTVNYTDQPIAQDPGGITAEDAKTDPTQARQANLDFDAGEVLEQTRIGLLYKSELSAGREMEARIYRTNRDFSNKLPFQNGGIVQLDRGFTGAGVKYTVEGNIGHRENRITGGIDYDNQDDDRSRFDNLFGVTDQKTFEQNELVTSLGLFLQNETMLTDDTELTVGMRYDEVKFEVTDKFLDDGDDSGTRNFYNISPMLGISTAIYDDTRLYGTISTGFETPTSTELANPVGGGFNESIEPQESINYEIGIKTENPNFSFEVALFHIDVENELIPFELADQPGRPFFENAGSSSRNGLELSYSRQLAEQVGLVMSYTYSDFTFDDYSTGDGDTFDGNQTPGIPQDVFFVDLSWFGDSGFYAKWDTTYTSELFADNANQVNVSSSTVSNLRFGHNAFYDDWTLAFFAGVNNLFNENYNNNVRINAFGGRYFEPAPERNIYLGLTLRKNFEG